MPRAPTKMSTGRSKRHDPLHIQLREDASQERLGKVSNPGRRDKRKRADNDDEDEVILDSKTSRRILELARDQQNELMDDEPSEKENEEPDHAETGRVAAFDVIQNEDSDAYDSEDGFGEEYEELEIDEEDLNTLDTLLPPTNGARRTLADLILEKLDGAGDGETPAKKVRIRDDGRPPDPAAGLDPKIVDVYRRVGLLLRSKNPRLPKPFKIIPSHPEWARLLALTSPEEWSPMATFAATRILISNLKPAQAQVYLEGVLLEIVRKNIMESEGKKLSVHLYNSLKKATFKPRAFYKGIVFPLCENACTLREAAIVGSVIAKLRLPPLESAGALQRLARMDYSGPNSLFIRIILDKKYDLPYKLLDTLVLEHFIPLANSRAQGKKEAKLPVLWHQSLLVFVQRYASDLSQDQKDALLDVVRIQFHPQIGPEIRRHLVQSVARGEPRSAADGAGDIVMAPA